MSQWVIDKVTFFKDSGLWVVLLFLAILCRNCLQYTPLLSGVSAHRGYLFTKPALQE
jgi:hypothetical protein